MQTHLANCLSGPITCQREWWLSADDEVIPDLSDPDIRADLVLRIRREIAEGTYDTPEKMEKALRRLVEEIDE